MLQDPLAFLNDPTTGGPDPVGDAVAHGPGPKLDNGGFCAWDETGCHTPSVCEALLETDTFLVRFTE